MPTQQNKWFTEKTPMSGVKPDSLRASCVLNACAVATGEDPCCPHPNTIKMLLMQVFGEQNAKSKDISRKMWISGS